MLQQPRSTGLVGIGQPAELQHSGDAVKLVTGFLPTTQTLRLVVLALLVGDTDLWHVRHNV